MNGDASSIDAGLTAARASWQAGAAAAAESALRALVARAPAREDVATLLAEVLRNQARLSAAAGAMLDLARAAPRDVGIALRAAEFARTCDRHEVAALICSAALAFNARDPGLLTLAGHVAREQGDFDTARAHYRAALDAGVDPDRQHVLGALVNTRRYTDPADPDLALCGAYFRDVAHSAGGRAAAGYALAKILDDVGDYARAASVLREVNGMAARLQPWDAVAWSRLVVQRTHEVVARTDADAGFVPVFVVGVPRSGTTVTASRLARATGARDRGELRALRFIAGRLRSGGYLGDRAAVAEAADLYRRLARQDDAPARIYIDQDPLNFRWLDIAGAMFPQARFIHLRRDPRDTALSLWSQQFAHPDMAFANRFEDIATFRQGHDALMACWRQLPGESLREVDYEALVAEPERVIADLAAFIGAPVLHDDPGHAAPVGSSSVWQARQPVYTTSVGRWRRYEQFIPELRTIA